MCRRRRTVGRACAIISTHAGHPSSSLFFFFNDTATTEIYTLSLHDALPIYGDVSPPPDGPPLTRRSGSGARGRSEEHTSELQSRLHLVCRLLLEKKKRKNAET